MQYALVLMSTWVNWSSAHMLDVCLEGLLFELQPGHCQPRRHFLWYSSVPPGRCCSFTFIYPWPLLNSYQFIIYQLSCNCNCIDWGADRIFKWAKWALSFSCSIECRRTVVCTCTSNFWGLTFTLASFHSVGFIQPNVRIVSSRVPQFLHSPLNLVESANSNKNHNKLLWNVTILFDDVCSSLLAFFHF